MCKEIRSKRKEFIHFYISYAVIPNQIYTSLRDFRLSNAEDQGVQLRRSKLKEVGPVTFGTLILC